MELLYKNNYSKVKSLLYQLPFNTLFAKAVIEDFVDGNVYTDNDQNPKTAYIVHPYGMSLLVGASDNEQFNFGFHDHAFNINSTRTTHEWMQAYPSEWNDALKTLFNGKLICSADNTAKLTKGVVELNTRINLKFNIDLYKRLKKTINAQNITLVPINTSIFSQMKGSVVPFYFWKSAEQFLNIGAGFSLFYNGKLASTAYSAFVHDDKLELGIETVEEYRGKGFALYACSALIDHCICKGFEPVWACRKENVGSYNLAQKLGFEPIREIPYYRLSN